MTPPALLGAGATERFGLMAHEIVWIAQRDGGPPRPDVPEARDTGLTLALDALVEENRRLAAQLRRARRRATAVEEQAGPGRRSTRWPLVGWRHG